jgi:hypothetical protein
MEMAGNLMSWESSTKQGWPGGKIAKNIDN